MNRYFSTPPVFSAPVSSINREAGIIQGITVARVGPARGHGGFIDRTFLLQIVDNASGKGAGVKARFGHPNMCTTALGTYLGRFKNYSYSGDQVKADLHLDETAKSTPNGDLFSYVLDMAEKNPDMFGASIAFEVAESEFLSETVDGKNIENEYFRLKDLRATDIVDEPAATDGLFSADTFPAIATQFLDENQQVAELIFTKPESVIEFLSNYLNNSNMNLTEKLKANFAAFLDSFSVSQVKLENEPEPLASEPAIDETTSPDPEPEPEDHQVETLTRELETRNEKLETLSQKLETLSQELETRNLELETLRQQLAARPSIPLNVTDPALSTTNQVQDETGKQILAAMPKDMKRKLSSNIKTTK